MISIYDLKFKISDFRDYENIEIFIEFDCNTERGERCGCHVRYDVPTAETRDPVHKLLFADAYSIDEYDECSDDEFGFGATYGRSNRHNDSRSDSALEWS